MARAARRREGAAHARPGEWIPTGAEAKAAGLVDELVKGDDVVDKAVAVVRERIAAGGGRRFDAAESARLNKVNAEESATLANAFVSNDFLSAMYDFNVKRGGKSQLKTIFWMAKTTLPLWQPAKSWTVVCGLIERLYNTCVRKG